MTDAPLKEQKGFFRVLQRVAKNPNSYNTNLAEANAIQWAVREIRILRGRVDALRLELKEERR